MSIMKTILRGRLSYLVKEVQEAQGKWEATLELDSSVEQTIFFKSGFLREHGREDVAFPFDMHSSTHKLLRPALLAYARVELISKEKSVLEVCFAKTISPHNTFALKLISRRHGVLEDDLPDDIQIEIPEKEIKSKDIFPKISFREWWLRLPIHQQLPRGGTPVFG